MQSTKKEGKSHRTPPEPTYCKRQSNSDCFVLQKMASNPGRFLVVVSSLPPVRVYSFAIVSIHVRCWSVCLPRTKLIERKAEDKATLAQSRITPQRISYESPLLDHTPNELLFLLPQLTHISPRRCLTCPIFNPQSHATSIPCSYASS